MTLQVSQAQASGGHSKHECRHLKMPLYLDRHGFSATFGSSGRMPAIVDPLAQRCPACVCCTVSSAAPSWAEKYEYKRLAARLANMPTTEEHDLALLEGGSLDSWRQRLLVRFRVQRKRGLRQALQRMEQAWAAKSASPGAACQSNSSKAEPAGAQDGKADLISLQKCSPAGPAWAGTRTWTDMVAAAVAQADAWKEIAIPSAVFLTFVVLTVPLSVSAVVCLVVPVAVWLQL